MTVQIMDGHIAGESDLPKVQGWRVASSTSDDFSTFQSQGKVKVTKVQGHPEKKAQSGIFTLITSCFHPTGTWEEETCGGGRRDPTSPYTYMEFSRLKKTSDKNKYHQHRNTQRRSQNGCWNRKARRKEGSGYSNDKSLVSIFSSNTLPDCKKGTKVSCSTLLFMIFASQTLLYTACSALDPRYKY